MEIKLEDVGASTTRPEAKVSGGHESASVKERPISISEFKRFMMCRLCWHWRSAPPRGLGLEPRVSAPELSLGKLIHEVLQLGYDQRRSFEEIYWELVPQYDPPQSELFREERQKTLDQLDLGGAMMRGYDSWHVEADEPYRFLATETRGSVPLPDTDIELSFIMDALVERHDGLWVLDFKTTSRSTTDWTDQDLQATAYVYAARHLYGPDVRGIIFRFLLKKAPRDYKDLILKSGKVTQRSNLSNLTTHAEYLKAIAISMLMRNNADIETPQQALEVLPKVKDTALFKKYFQEERKVYWEQLQDLRGGDSTYFWDKPEFRSEVEVANYMNNVLVPVSKQIRDPQFIGPTGLAMAWAACSRCPFREPCKLAMQGADYQHILDTEFQLSERYQAELDEEDEEEVQE